MGKKEIQFLHKQENTQEFEAGSEQKRDRIVSTMLFNSLISLLLSWQRTDTWIVPQCPKFPWSSCEILSMLACVTMPNALTEVDEIICRVRLTY